MIRNFFFFCALVGAMPAYSQVQQFSSATYADVADLTADAPIVAQILIQKTSVVENGRAPGLAPGRQRLYVVAQVERLIRGPDMLTSQIRFLVDVTPDARGRPPRIRKQRMFVMARAVPGRPDELRLIRPDALLAATPDHQAMVEAILGEAMASDAPRAISGIASAFHVAGTIRGEGESQFFLNTAGGEPISISVARHAGQARQWGVSLGEVVGLTARPPVKGTLLWYRLACGGLPRQLPPALLAGANEAERAAAQDDYAFVMAELGACVRSMR